MRGAMTDSQIERVGCHAWGPMVTGFPFAVFLHLMSGPGGELPAGVPHDTRLSATLGSWPTGRQPSEEMAPFLFLTARKARLTPTGERSGARQKKGEEAAQSWPELQAVKYQWGGTWKPTSSNQNRGGLGLQGLGSPGPEGGWK